MKKYLITILLCLSTSALAQEAQVNAQVNALVDTQVNTQVNGQVEEAAADDEVPVEEAPKPVEIQDPKLQAWLNKNIDQPFVSLINEYTIIVKPDWSYEEIYHARIKIQKEEAKDLGQWPVYYNKVRDSITEISARVETPDGRQYPATDIQDKQVHEDSSMYEDMRMKLVTLPEISVGSIIDVTVKSTSRKEIPNQFWGEVLYPAIPAQRSTYIFIVPQEMPLEFKAYKMQEKPIVENSQGQIKYTFTLNDTLPIPHEEELMPPLQDVLGGLYLSSMKDWKIVADWYRELTHKNMVEDVDISLKVVELTKEKTTSKDKARAILEFIQDNFRYVDLNFGNNTVEPHPTKDIFQNHYGDSKDLTLLAKQMLKLAGIDANTCLFSAEFAGNPQAGLPNPSVFSHVILEVNLDGQQYFVDPVLKGFDFGQYPASYDNAYVLVIDDAAYRFDHLPITGEEHRVLMSKAEVMITPEGSAQFRVHVTLPLDSSQSFKQSWGSSTDEDKDKFFESLEQNFASSGKMVDRKVIGLENRYGPIEFDFKYDAINVYPLINDMILIKEADQSDMPDFANPNRQHPLFMPSNSVIKNTNTYHVPEGFTINFIPPAYSLSVDLMDATVNYVQKDNTVETNSTYRIKRSIIPAERYGQIQDFRKELIKKNDQYIIFKKSSNISTEAKEWVKSQ